MEQTKKMLKISAIINLILAMFIIQIIKPWGIILGITGVILLSYTVLSKEELRKKRPILIAIDISMLILNMISFILLIIAIDQMTITEKEELEEKTKHPLISKEQKQMDWLIKLGLSMIMLSGILFATTSWNMISNLGKIIILIVIGIIFLLLSRFSEKTLKILKTTFAYYFLGLAFLLLGWIATLYFGILSPWFSYHGLGKSLAYTTTFICISIFTHFISKKFDRKEYQYISMMNIYLSIYHFLWWLQLPAQVIILLMIILSLGISIGEKRISNPQLQCVNQVISSLYWILILNTLQPDKIFLTILVILFNIINAFYCRIKNKSQIENFITIVSSYLLIIVGIINICPKINHYLIIIPCITIFSLWIRMNRFNQEKSLIYPNQIIYMVICFFSMIELKFQLYSSFSLEKTFPSPSCLLLMISLLYFGMNKLYAVDWKNNNNHQIENQTRPLSTFFLIYSIYHIINSKIILLEKTISLFSIAGLIFLGICLLIKKEEVQKKYFIAQIVLLILGMFSNYLFHPKVVDSIILLILSIYLYGKTKKDPTKSPYSYSLILIQLYFLFITMNILSITTYANCLLVILIYGIIRLLLTDQKRKKITEIAMVIPMYSFIQSIHTTIEITAILKNLLGIYIVLCITKGFIQDQKTKDTFSTIAIAILILGIIGTEGIWIGLYIGLLAIILILFSTYNKEYKKLFYLGIIITGLNIIIELQFYWQELPFWLYLLIAGIIIMMIATVKELKKNEEKNILEKQEIFASKILEKKQNNQQPTPIKNFCPNCGRKNENHGKYCPNCGTNLQN